MPLDAGPLDACHPAWKTLIRAGFGAARIDEVLARYDEPHRCYHNRVHLREMLDTALAMDCQPSAPQAMAVLFHDAVYVPGAARGANEALSAQLLRVYGHGLPAPLVEQACEIITDTADHVARSEAARLVLDLDLMRLAATGADFERYSRQVFVEQRPLLAMQDDEAAWRFFQQRRVGFFERLLQRREVFCLPAFRRRYEAVTRANLQRAIQHARALCA